MAYSLDLRTRIVDAVDRGVGTMSEIAALFGVNEPFIYKLLRQRCERGDIVMLDNVKFHYSERSINLIEATGAGVRRLPRYSPDFSPIDDLTHLKTVVIPIILNISQKLAESFRSPIFVEPKKGSVSQ